MDTHHLVTMANNIGSYFASDPDRTKGAKGIADHIRSFWDPRMRRELLAYLDTGGAGLDALVLDALKTHRANLQPGTK
jgi:formate dehydrogenase subunit delta